jgi:hypothetical protein
MPFPGRTISSVSQADHRRTILYLAQVFSYHTVSIRLGALKNPIRVPSPEHRDLPVACWVRDNQ